MKSICNYQRLDLFLLCLNPMLTDDNKNSFTLSQKRCPKQFYWPMIRNFDNGCAFIQRHHL